MRLIDADALLQRAIPHGWSTPLWVSDIAIEDAPTIDAVTVVRCGDCKYYRDGRFGKYCWLAHLCVDENWFCASGERKSNEAN